MRIFTILLSLLLIGNAYGQKNISSDYGDTTINSFVTVGGYWTTRNNFQDKDSTNGANLTEVGVQGYHIFNRNFTVAARATSKNLFDYGFIQINKPLTDTSFGVRLGRINVLSGLFSGFGSSVDDMNHLPQGTSPDRLGTAVYRFDGIQAYLKQNTGDFSQLILEASYGENVVDSEIGVYEPAFAAAFVPESLTADYSRPAWLINLDWYYNSFEFMVNYTDMVASLSARYQNVIPLAVLTGNPEDYNTPYEINTVINDDDYPSTMLKVGIAYGHGNFEHMLLYMRWKDTPGSFESGDIKLSSEYVSVGWSYVLRHALNYQFTNYIGYSEYRGTFDNEELVKLLKSAPAWVDRGQEILLGTRFQVNNDVHVIVEGHLVKGGIFLSGEFQDPNTAKEYWGLYSMTINYIF